MNLHPMGNQNVSVYSIDTVRFEILAPADFFDSNSARDDDGLLQQEDTHEQTAPRVHEIPFAEKAHLISLSYRERLIAKQKRGESVPFDEVGANFDSVWGNDHGHVVTTAVLSEKKQCSLDGRQ